MVPLPGFAFPNGTSGCTGNRQDGCLELRLEVFALPGEESAGRPEQNWKPCRQRSLQNSNSRVVPLHDSLGLSGKSCS